MSAITPVRASSTTALAILLAALAFAACAAPSNAQSNFPLPLTAGGQGVRWDDFTMGANQTLFVVGSTQLGAYWTTVGVGITPNPTALTLPFGAQPFGPMRVAGEGQFVAGALNLMGGDRVIHLWDLTTPSGFQIVPTPPGARAELTDLAYTPQRGVVVSGTLEVPAAMGGPMRAPFLWTVARGFQFPVALGATQPAGAAAGGLDALGRRLAGYKPDGNRPTPTSAVIWSTDTRGLVPMILERSPGDDSLTRVLSPNGASAAGETVLPDTRVTVWLEAESQAPRRLDANAFLSPTVGIAARPQVLLDDGTVFGTTDIPGTGGAASRAWAWHPSFGSDQARSLNALAASSGLTVSQTLARAVTAEADGNTTYVLAGVSSAQFPSVGQHYLLGFTALSATQSLGSGLQRLGGGSRVPGFSMPTLSVLGPRTAGSEVYLLAEAFDPSFAGEPSLLIMGALALPAPQFGGLMVDINGPVFTFQAVTPNSGINGTASAMFGFLVPPGVSGARFIFQHVSKSQALSPTLFSDALSVTLP